MRSDFYPVFGVVILAVAIISFFVFISVLSTNSEPIQNLILIALLLIGIRIASAIGVILGYNWSRFFFLSLAVLNLVLFIFFINTEGFKVNSSLGLMQITDLVVYVLFSIPLFHPVANTYFKAAAKNVEA